MVVDGEPSNRKITLPDDLEWAREMLGAMNEIDTDGPATP